MKNRLRSVLEIVIKQKVLILIWKIDDRTCICTRSLKIIGKKEFFLYFWNFFEMRILRCVTSVEKIIKNEYIRSLCEAAIAD